jgi:hypothetical protein
MILQNIQDILEKEEFICSILPANETLPVERLQVFLGSDLKNRERMLEIRAGLQQLSQEITSLPQPQTPPARVQFLVQLPFKVKDSALSQVASMLLFLNPLIDLPGFELDELHGRVTYRYVWIIKPEAIDALLILSIVSTILLNLSLCSDNIESLADGKLSFNDLLAQAVQLTEKS